MSKFTIERVYPHTRDRVWTAITDPTILAQWLMPNDFQPRLGHEFTFTTDPGPGFDGIVHCTVTNIDPPHRLAFTWKGGPIDTLVEFELHEHPDGTRLTMTQSGFKGVKARLVGAMLKFGSAPIYGKRLPAALDELAGITRTSSDPPACMSPSQGLIVRLLRIFERKTP